MLHAYLHDASFWATLLAIDEDLAAQTRRGGCAHCGSRLHFAGYRRKPRGVPRSVLGPAYERRLSYCCARAGCRRRATPRSVRFFDRRGYLGALVILVAALEQGMSGSRRQALRRHFGVHERTVWRWRRWWRQVFPSTRGWREARGRWVCAVSVSALPGSLLERFSGEDPEKKTVQMLRYLAALSSA